MKLILEENGSYIYYIRGEKSIVEYDLSRLLLDGNQESTQKPTYQKEILSEINEIEEIPEGTFTINLKLIQRHQ